MIVGLAVNGCLNVALVWMLGVRGVAILGVASGVSAIFLLASFARTYILRRVFNRLFSPDSDGR
jgi:O-antigen/teichoic acid export membrane protein